jgi:Tfp pilus assembly protein PilE
MNQRGNQKGNQKGFILITVMVFLAILSLIVSHDFYNAKLQQKAANAALVKASKRNIYNRNVIK